MRSGTTSSRPSAANPPAATVLLALLCLALALIVHVAFVSFHLGGISPTHWIWILCAIPYLAIDLTLLLIAMMRSRAQRKG